VAVLTELDASAIRRWCSAMADSLASHQSEINALNVYPVADADTGTNMALTARAADAAVRSAPESTAAGVLQSLARGAALSAQGNSGVILSQLFRGMAEAVGDGTEISADVLCRALSQAAVRGYESVGEPVEGTILSVAAAAAKAAAEFGEAARGEAARGEVARAEEGLGEVIRSALRAAEEALRHTPEQLDVLARAGVVDAGGRGLVVVLEALCEVITGDSPRPMAEPPAAAPTPAVRESGSSEFGYEVQYLLDAPVDAVAPLRDALVALGDSLAVVGTDEGVWNVHIHVNDIGAAIEAGVAVGPIRRITVQRFADQAAAAAPADRSGVAVVAVAPGKGLAHLFAGEGVRVVEGSAEDHPSPADVLAAVRASGAAKVVLLPNASQVSGVAEEVAELARADGIEVAVVPTRSPVQGLAAVAVYDPQRRFGDLVIAMAETAAATQWAELTVAVRDALTIAGPCHAGDVVGLIGGEVVEIGSDLRAVAERVLDRLLGVGAELVTVLLGADTDAELGAELTRYVGSVAPLVEVCTFATGQRSAPLLIGVE
jgi:uncharacterized protein